MKAAPLRALLLCAILASLNHGVFSAVMLEPVSSLYLPGSYDGNDGIVCLDQSAAEKFAYSADTQTVYVIGSEVFHTVSVEDATNPEILSMLELTGEGTDVAVCGGYVAFSYVNDDALEPGTVVIMPELSEDLSEAVNVTVGPVPDQVTFTPDCSKLLVANEGEAGAVDNYVVDPEGGVSIIDVAMLFGDNPPADSQDAHTMVDFRAFNDRVDELVAQGVRYVYKGEAAEPDAEPHTLAQDLEPEYVAVSSDGTTAYVALQENNAIAVVDIEAATVTGIYGMGMKKYSDINAVIDPSDRDGIRLASWPVFGMFQPDAITYFESNGRAYLATANEGDAKEYFGDDGLLWTEEASGEDLDDLLDTDDEDLLAALVDENLLGRLTVTLVDGVLERNENGSTASLDGVYAYGGRSFSIIDVETMSVVFDSADDLELRHKAYLPRIFNTNGPEGDFCPFDEDFADLGDTPEAIVEALLETAEADEEAEIPEDLTLTAFDNLDNRSDNKGPEPESLAIGEMDGMTLLFVGNERTSTIAVYDITDPVAPVFQSLFSMPTEGTFWERYNEQRLGDVDPEHLKFVSADKSPTGEAVLIVSGSVSGTLSMYRVVNMVPEAATSSPDTAELATMATYACEPASAPGGELLSIYPLDAAITLEALNPEAIFPRLSNGVTTTALVDGSEVTVFDNNEQGMLAGEECPNRSPQEGCIDFPAMFSGLSLDMPAGISLPGSASDVLQFIGLTDRGLNQDCGDLAELGFNTAADSGKAFPAAEFSPTFAQVNIDTASGVVSVAGTGVCHLKDTAGVPATGVSNGENDDTPFNTDCQSRLDYNPNGVDAEDMHRIGDSDMCLMVEEYSSSVLIVDCNFADADACGTVMMRYTPEGVTLDGATYPVSDILPAEIAQRRKNRGFENAAVSPDGTRAYVLVQSPMLGNDTNLWIRVLEMDISDPLEASVTGQYMYMGDSEELWTEAAFVPKDVKLSAATWIGGEDSTTIMVLERAKKQVKLYTIDFSGADNILGTPEAASLAYENFEAEAVPGEKTLILDTAQVEGWDSSIHSDKQEGVAIINPCVVAMGADNDFGLGNSGRSEMYVVQLGSCLSGECPAQASAGRKLL